MSEQFMRLRFERANGHDVLLVLHRSFELPEQQRLKNQSGG